MFTAMYERVKGQAEKAIFDFYTATPNFKLYTVRPAGVDWRDHPAIQPFIPSQPFWKRALLPAIDTFYNPMITPTRPMGRIMTELAMSKGEPLEGDDLQMDGTLVSNVAFRRLANL
ncbi:hypothetical protein PMIN04_000571 [Paraphaeosphaeria minitans]